MADTTLPADEGHAACLTMPALQSINLNGARINYEPTGSLAAYIGQVLVGLSLQRLTHSPWGGRSHPVFARTREDQRGQARDAVLLNQRSAQKDRGVEDAMLTLRRRPPFCDVRCQTGNRYVVENTGVRCFRLRVRVSS